MEDDRDLIELPGTDALLEIAQAAANGSAGSTIGDDGDMSAPLDLSGPNDDDDATPQASRRTPIRGHVSYLSLAIPMDVYLAFSAYDERQIVLQTQDWEALTKSERLVRWMQGMVGRDLEADEHRAPDDRLYWWGGLFRGLSYKTLIQDTHMKGYDVKLKQQLRLLRRQQRERVKKQLGPEWSDEAVDDLLGTVGMDDD